MNNRGLLLLAQLGLCLVEPRLQRGVLGLRVFQVRRAHSADLGQGFSHLEAVGVDAALQLLRGHGRGG